MPPDPYTAVHGGWGQESYPEQSSPVWECPKLIDGDIANPVDCGVGWWQSNIFFVVDLGSPKPVDYLKVHDTCAETEWWSPTRDTVWVYKSIFGSTWSRVGIYNAPPRFPNGFTLSLPSVQFARYWLVWNFEFSDLQTDDMCHVVICELEAHPPAVTYSFKGTIKLQGVPVSRYVAAFRRSDYSLVSFVLSEAAGTFSIPALDDTTECFVVAFDDDAGEMYNALIYDRVKGVLDT